MYAYFQTMGVIPRIASRWVKGSTFLTFDIQCVRTLQTDDRRRECAASLSPFVSLFDAGLEDVWGDVTSSSEPCTCVMNDSFADPAPSVPSRRSSTGRLSTGSTRQKIPGESPFNNPPRWSVQSHRGCLSASRCQPPYGRRP